MIVYGSSLSPFVRKVIVFAAEKGIAVTVKPVAPGSDDPEFRSVSPFGTMPGLRDGDFTLADSSAIVAYLEAVQPEPALIPAAPQARGRAIWWDEFGDTILFPCFRPMFFDRVVQARILKAAVDPAAADRAERETMPPLLDWLEGQVPDAGPLLGDAVSLADIAVVSPFVNLDHAGVAIDRWPRIQAYVAQMLVRPSFAGAVAGDRAFLARFPINPRTDDA